MKHLLLILSLTFAFSQTKLETRVYELPRIEFTNGYYYDLDISTITGYELDYGILKLIHVDDFYLFNQFCEVSMKSIYYSYHGGEDYTTSEIELHDTGNINYQKNSNSSIVYHNGQANTLFFQGSSGWVDLVLSITAEFPIEETGYLDEGFDFCVHEGQNLVSYPCENGLTIADTFPSEALAQFSGIVGEGQASTPINGSWVGSINTMTPTKGYWINSNSSFCFNYDCSED